MDSLANKHIKITSNTVKNYKPGFQHNKIKCKIEVLKPQH